MKILSVILISFLLLLIPAHSAPADSQTAASVSISSTGLTLTVPAFEFDGSEYPGGSISALPQTKSFLVLNRKTRRLHLLPRAIGDGEIVLAEVTAGTNSIEITPQAPALRPIPLPKTLAKLAAGEPVEVACFGTSLVENGGGKTGWQRLLFDEDHPDSEFRAGPHFVRKSYAVGGTNARYTFSLFGSAKVGNEKLETNAYQAGLAVVALIPNGGQNRLPLFEAVVRSLRARGVEVLLLTDNAMAGKGESDALWRDGEFVRKLANRYGCAVADTASYMREAELRGEKVYADNIHQSPEGHRHWAEAASGVLSAWGARPSEVSNADVATDAPIPALVLVDLDPVAIGAKRESSAPGNRYDKTFGRRTGALLLPVGGKVQLRGTDLLSADLVFDASSGFVAEVSVGQGGEVLTTLSYKAPDKIPPRPQTRAVLLPDTLQAQPASEYTVTVKEGQLNLYGVSYQLTK